MLNGKTLGIIGCGRIASWMSRYSHAFGMKCLGTILRLPIWTNILPCELDFLLENSDFSLHVNYETNLEKFIGEEFSLMKKGSILLILRRVNWWKCTNKSFRDISSCGAGVDVLRDEQNIRKNLLIKININLKIWS